MIPLYMKKAKVDEEKVKELINAESWLGAKEVDETFDVNLIKEQKQVAACASNLFKNYKNVPQKFKNMLKKAETPKLDYSDFEKRLFKRFSTQILFYFNRANFLVDWRNFTTCYSYFI